MLRAIPDLIFRMRVDGTYIDVIDGATAPVLPRESFLGRNIRDLPFPRPFIDKALQHLENTVREGTLNVFEYELETPEGLQHFEARIVRSGPDEAVCFVRDITERKRAEKHRAQLVRAERMASLGQLLTGMAHEINNPVGYVTSNLNTLGQYVSELTPLLRTLRDFLEAQGPGTSPSHAEPLSRLREQWNGANMRLLLEDMPELIQESLTGTRRITEIVQSLRRFLREDTEELQLVDLNAELESTLRRVWSELRYKCEVKRELGPLPAIMGYPTQLSQVFAHVLVNAAQAIETQGEIHIRTWHHGSEAVVAISDTGKGMTPETLSRLFTPFFTTRPRGEGTGLGLAISRDILSRHNGRIEARSEPGKGSTFTLYLPSGGGSLPRPSA